MKNYLQLDCRCEDPRCFVYFLYDGSSKRPELEIGIEYCDLSFWNRIKTVWGILRQGRYKKRADVVLNQITDAERLRDFCGVCIEASRSSQKQE
jgi:hypothetical protein